MVQFLPMRLIPGFVLIVSLISIITPKITILRYDTYRDILSLKPYTLIYFNAEWSTDSKYIFNSQFLKSLESITSYLSTITISGCDQNQSEILTFFNVTSFPKISLYDRDTSAVATYGETLYKHSGISKWLLREGAKNGKYDVFTDTIRGVEQVNEILEDTGYIVALYIENESNDIHTMVKMSKGARDIIDAIDDYYKPDKIYLLSNQTLINELVHLHPDRPTDKGNDNVINCLIIKTYDEHINLFHPSAKGYNTTKGTGEYVDFIRKYSHPVIGEYNSNDYYKLYYHKINFSLIIGNGLDTELEVHYKGGFKELRGVEVLGYVNSGISGNEEIISYLGDYLGYGNEENIRGVIVSNVYNYTKKEYVKYLYNITDTNSIKDYCNKVFDGYTQLKRLYKSQEISEDDMVLVGKNFNSVINRNCDDNAFSLVLFTNQNCGICKESENVIKEGKGGNYRESKEVKLYVIDIIQNEIENFEYSLYPSFVGYTPGRDKIFFEETIINKESILRFIENSISDLGGGGYGGGDHVERNESVGEIIKDNTDSLSSNSDL